MNVRDKEYVCCLIGLDWHSMYRVLVMFLWKLLHSQIGVKWRDLCVNFDGGALQVGSLSAKSRGSFIIMEYIDVGSRSNQVQKC